MIDDRKGDREVDSAAKEDADAPVQREIRREEAEGRDLIGDTRDNRNVSGSSTWETLPDGQDESKA